MHSWKTIIQQNWLCILRKDKVDYMIIRGIKYIIV